MEDCQGTPPTRVEAPVTTVFDGHGQEKGTHLQTFRGIFHQVNDNKISGGTCISRGEVCWADIQTLTILSYTEGEIWHADLYVYRSPCALEA